MSLVDRFDRFQRRHSVAGFPIAVVYKLVDDRGPYLAALITYYGFVSLFPLLLLFTTILGYVAHGNPGLQRDLTSSALANFPIVGDKITNNISGFTGSGTALAVGIAGALYGGIGVMQAAQAAFNTIYAVPRNEQPNPFVSRLRSLLLLIVLGTGVLITTGLGILVSTGNSLGKELGSGLQVAARLLTVALDIAIFTAAYQLLVARRLAVRRVLVGGVLSGVIWQLLQTEGTAYLAHELNRSGRLYGTFALVLGLLAWIYLEALAVIVCAEINVTLHKRLWPRALLTPFTDEVSLTEADQRAYTSYARSQRFKGFQRIMVDFSRTRPASDTTEPYPDAVGGASSAETRAVPQAPTGGPR